MFVINQQGTDVYAISETCDRAAESIALSDPFPSLTAGFELNNSTSHGATGNRRDIQSGMRLEETVEHSTVDQKR